MILLVDNYDSFSYNLVHFLGELGAEVEVRRNDVLGVADVLAMQPEAVVLSPGPGQPDDAGICVEMVQAAAAHRLPLLGVCLGHQAIGRAFGAKVVRAEVPMHGKRSSIHHTGRGVFRGLANPFEATRYHSLVVDRATLPDTIEVVAETDGAMITGRLIMGMMHRTLPIHGVQFHPESIATEHGHALLANFLEIAKGRKHAA